MHVEYKLNANLSYRISSNFNCLYSGNEKKMHGTFFRKIYCGVQRQRKYVLDRLLNSLFNILKIATVHNYQTFIKEGSVAKSMICSPTNFQYLLYNISKFLHIQYGDDDIGADKFLAIIELDYAERKLYSS